MKEVNDNMQQNDDKPKYIRGKYSLGQKIATTKYNTAHYEQIILRVKTGQKERLKNIAQKKNMPLNVFIFDCIIKRLFDEDIESYNYLFSRDGEDNQEK